MTNPPAGILIFKNATCLFFIIYVGKYGITLCAFEN